MSSNEASTYAAVGASSSKTGVLAAVKNPLYGRYFCEPLLDPSSDSPAKFLHADGAGTKSIVAYLAYRSGSPASVFRSLATDSLVMNLDDLLCVGARGPFLLSNIINRSRSLINDEIISELIDGYRECAESISRAGIRIELCGGETADCGDVVRTISIDSSMFVTVPRDQLIDMHRVVPGDVIVGLRSFKETSTGEKPNSGIASNGLSLARHVLLHHSYAETFPEVCDPQIDKAKAYRGPFRLEDRPPELEGLSVGEALLSPTPTYAEVITQALLKLGNNIHGIIHCTGGGQTKIKRFGRNLKFIKDDFFAIPPVFRLIQAIGNIPWQEMFSVFNMGHRLELILSEEHADELIKVSKSLGIDAKRIGRVASSENGNQVVIDSPHGSFSY